MYSMYIYIYTLYGIQDPGPLYTRNSVNEIRKKKYTHKNYGFQQIKKLYNRGFTSEPKVKIPKKVALFTICKRENINLVMSDFY